MKIVTVGCLLLLVLALAGCAAGHNHLKDVPGTDGTVAGFWLGLWHGIILPISFLMSLFSDNVNIYEVHNSGAWYNFGFLLGAGLILGGAGASS